MRFLLNNLIKVYSFITIAQTIKLEQIFFVSYTQKSSFSSQLQCFLTDKRVKFK